MSFFHTVILSFDCDEEEPATWDAVAKIRTLIEGHLDRVCELIYISGSGSPCSIIKWTCNYGTTPEFVEAVRSFPWPGPLPTVSIVQWPEDGGPKIVLAFTRGDSK